MVDILPASDPRVRVEMTLHPPESPDLVLSLPRWDYLDEQTVRAIKVGLREFKDAAQEQGDKIRRHFRSYRLALKRYEKALTAWEKRLDDPGCDDPGPEPEEPTRPDFDDQMDERDAERAVTLLIFRHVLTGAEYEALDKCTTAEIMQAKALWDRESETPLGELSASPTSSTGSTEGLSAPTSSTEVGVAETSASASDGPTSVT